MFLHVILMGNSFQIYGPEAVFDIQSKPLPPVEQPVPVIRVNQPSLPKAAQQPSKAAPKMLFTRVKLTSKINKQKQDGVKTINAYTVGATIGTGLFGKVKRVTRVENGVQRDYAMKILKKSLMTKKKVYYKDDQGIMRTKDGYEFMHREIAAYKKIRHPNLIRLYEVLLSEDPAQEKVYLIMELAERGQLIDWDNDEDCWKFTDEDREERITEAELRAIARGMIKGIHHLHLNGIIHRDIKPQNILFSASGQVKISDFGISQLNTQLRVNQITGTDFFLGPESFQPEKLQLVDGKALDIWAFGVTLYCYFYMKVPFFSNRIEGLAQIITSQEPEYDEPISAGLLRLFKSMLNKNPKQRPTINQLALDPWINEGSKQLLLELDTQVIRVSQEELKESINPTIKKSVQTVSQSGKQALQPIKPPEPALNNTQASPFSKKPAQIYESKVEVFKSPPSRALLQLPPKSQAQLELQESAVWPMNVPSKTQPQHLNRPPSALISSYLNTQISFRIIEHLDPFVPTYQPDYQLLEEYYANQLKRS